jgi:hypothetical protein
MLARLEQQKKLTANQWRIILTTDLSEMLDFFDFFLIGYFLAFILKEWHITYGQSASILIFAGLVQCAALRLGLDGRPHRPPLGVYAGRAQCRDCHRHHVPHGGAELAVSGAGHFWRSSASLSASAMRG